MEKYFEDLKIRIQKELKNAQKENVDKCFTCNVISCINIYSSFLVSLEQISHYRKNKMKFKEEEKITINKNIFADVLEAESTFIKCKSNIYIKPGSQVEISQDFYSQEKVLKAIDKILKKNKIKNCALSDFFEKYFEKKNKPVGKYQKDSEKNQEKDSRRNSDKHSEKKYQKDLEKSQEKDSRRNSYKHSEKKYQKDLEKNQKKNLVKKYDVNLEKKSQKDIKIEPKKDLIRNSDKDLEKKLEKDTKIYLKVSLNHLEHEKKCLDAFQKDFNSIDKQLIINNIKFQNEIDQMNAPNTQQDSSSLKFSSDNYKFNKSTDKKSVDSLNLRSNSETFSNKLSLDNKTEDITENLQRIKLISQKNPSDIILYNNNLNFQQKRCIEKIYENKSFKLLGPPGTGKTTTIIEMILQILKHNKKLLVCGPSNASIDNIIQSYLKTNPKLDFLRLGSSFKCFPGFEKFNLEYLAANSVAYLKEEIQDGQRNKEKIHNKQRLSKSNRNEVNDIKQSIQETKKDLKQKQNDFKSFKIKKTRLIFSTLYSSLKINYDDFDWIIIDECCQGSESEIILALLKAKNFILAGDPHQLGPTFESTQSIQIYECLKTDEIMLNEQYRMCFKLIEFSNSQFYHNLIISPKKSSLQIFNESSIVFIDTANSFYYENDSDGSKINIEEGKVIIKMVEYLNTKYKNHTIGVISPYSAQRSFLEDNMDLESNKNTEISTVDSFQGQERDIMIFTLTRSNENQSIGFLEDIKRTNVALTRCKMALIIVGNSDVFRKHGFYGNLITYLETNAFVIDPETLDILIS